MDLKDLNNYQLVLLTLLVSFVTSIATGIITVYLLQQSPTVSSVINQVIQRTVETVTPEQGQVTAQPGQVVVIKESDIVPVVVENAKKSIITIRYGCDLSDAEKLAGKTCLADSYGFVTGADGTFLTTVSINTNLSTALVYPANAANLSFIYTHSLYADNEFTYNKLSFPEGKKIAMPHVLAFAKLLPSEGETLILYDPRSATTKKLYVEKVDAGKKTFTVDHSVAEYEGLPILNLDGEVAGVVASTQEAVTIVSALQLANFKFAKISLTSN